MADERSGPRPTVRIAGIESATPSENGQTLRISLLSTQMRLVDLILPYDLAPGLQRLVSIVAERARGKRAQSGDSKVVLRAERVAAVNTVLPAPDGSVIVLLATAESHPLQFTLPGALAADLARQIAAAAPELPAGAGTTH